MAACSRLHAGKIGSYKLSQTSKKGFRLIYTSLEEERKHKAVVFQRRDLWRNAVNKLVWDPKRFKFDDK